ncbi:hypothetical protein [Shewanella benthica]|nr:hypothetical protein [Shewanella benthica]
MTRDDYQAQHQKRMADSFLHGPIIMGNEVAINHNGLTKCESSNSWYCFTIANGIFAIRSFTLFTFAPLMDPY